MQNGPELWDAILETMPEGAVVAGGAIRDYYLGVEPKDIDIFTAQTGSPENWSPYQVWDPRQGLHRIDARDEREEEYKALNDIACISRGARCGFHIDLVELTWEKLNPYMLIETFDFGITRCFYHPGTLHVSPEAMRDLQDRTVTLLLDDRRERATARFQRFNERTGGDWRLVECSN